MAQTGMENRKKEVICRQAEECREEVWRPRTSDEVSCLINGLARKLETEWRTRGFEHPDFRIRTVLEEAVLNAWFHGNKMDVRKSLTIRWTFSEDFLLEVEDEGTGFNADDVPDPTCLENITKPCGRGLFIIRHFSNEVQWFNSGRRLSVRLSKKFSPLA